MHLIPNSSSQGAVHGGAFTYFDRLHMLVCFLLVALTAQASATAAHFPPQPRLALYSYSIRVYFEFEDHDHSSKTVRDDVHPEEHNPFVIWAIGIIEPKPASPQVVLRREEEDKTYNIQRLEEGVQCPEPV